MTITGGADLKITTTPVVLEQRICSDSTNNRDMKKPEDEDIKRKNTATENLEKREERQQIQKKEEIIKKEPENFILKSLPIFVIIFMGILLIFNMISQATIELAPSALIGLSMASTISILYMHSIQ